MKNFKEQLITDLRKNVRKYLHNEIQISHKKRKCPNIHLCDHTNMVIKLGYKTRL